MRFLSGLTLALLLAACSFHESNKFSDPTLIKIAALQDRRKSDSLILFLVDKNPLYRSEAALALASVQDSTASLQLGSTLLEDPFTEARVHAAFALGQTGGYASVNALIPALMDSSSLVVKEVLQSLGKAVTINDLSALVNFQPSDSIQESGQAWGFYYAALRGITTDAMSARAEKFLSTKYSSDTRLAAAHYFNRGNNIKYVPVEALGTRALSDADAYVRMTSAAALRKADFSACAETLKKILSDEKDYRVRVSAARIIVSKVDATNEEWAIRALNDANESVAIAAAEALKNDFINKEGLLEIARTTKNFRLQFTLYKKLLSQQAKLSDEIKDLYQSSKNDYQRAGLLSALSEDTSAYNFLFQEFNKSEIPVIKTSEAQALTSMNYSTKFNIKKRNEFARIYKEALLDGDMGVIGIIANALADSTLHYKEVISDFSFLYETKKKLNLPRDYEALQPLDEAIAYFEGKEKPKAPKNEYNHPIDWKLLKSINKNQKVLITTSQGEITLKLLVEEAPGSVVNFVSLINQNYFDNKFVHRVVPNFVIQTGCNRGDGFGSEAYSIRSEFSMRTYTEGSVGMASAGKDTEGTQWFITHSPTPHLNGRYTIFAEVESGMDVVHKIQIGDKIITARLLDN